MEARTATEKRHVHTGPNRPGIERREKILRSAAELLLDRNFTEISYADIAKQAGLPISSCYYYYADRYVVFRALDLFLSQEFRCYMDFESAYHQLDNWQQAVDIYLHNGKAFIQAYPVAGHIWFKGKIPPAAKKANLRDSALSREFEVILDRQFVLPETSHRSEIFYVAWEVSEQVVSTIFTGEVDFDLAFSEAGKAMKAYLANYLPDRLPKRIRVPE